MSGNIHLCSRAMVTHNSYRINHSPLFKMMRAVFFMLTAGTTESRDAQGTVTIRPRGFFLVQAASLSSSMAHSDQGRKRKSAHTGSLVQGEESNADDTLSGWKLQ